MHHHLRVQVQHAIGIEHPDRAALVEEVPGGVGEQLGLHGRDDGGPRRSHDVAQRPGGLARPGAAEDDHRLVVGAIAAVADDDPGSGREPNLRYRPVSRHQFTPSRWLWRLASEALIPASRGVAPVDVLRRATLARNRRTTPSFQATRYSMPASPAKDRPDDAGRPTPAARRPGPGRIGEVDETRDPEEGPPDHRDDMRVGGTSDGDETREHPGEVGRHPDADSHRRADQHDSVGPAFCAEGCLALAIVPRVFYSSSLHSPPLSRRYPEGRPPGGDHRSR